MKASLSGPYGCWDLDEGSTVIGRDPSCTICIKDPRLSRRHVELHWDGTNLVVRDLGSSNGTLLNGDPIFTEQELKDHDILIIGPVACDVNLGMHSFARLPAIDPAAARQRRRSSTDSSQKQSEAPVPQLSARRGTEMMEPGEMVPEPPPQRLPPEDVAVQPVPERPGKRHFDGGYQRQRTEPLDPDVVTALFPQNLPVDGPDLREQQNTTKKALTSRRDSASGIDPAIADALQDQSRGGGGSSQKRSVHTTDHLRPDQSSCRDDMSALQRNDESHRTPSDPYLPDDQPVPQPLPVPEQPSPAAGSSVSKSLLRRYAMVALRLLAGVLDGLQVLVLLLLTSLPLVVVGYVVALLTVPVGLDEAGLPHRYGIEPAAGVGDILVSLLHWDGWVRMLEMMQILRERSQQAFLYCFLAVVAAVLAAVFVLLLAVIAPTTYRGGPFWHRRLGLVIVEGTNGYYPTPVRACLRWFLLLALLPLTPLLMLFALPGPHDLLCHCEVRHQRLSVTRDR